MGIFFKFIAAVIQTYCDAGSAAVDIVQNGFNSPLSHLGFDASMQTFLMALIPILTIVATIRLLHGPIRFMVVLSMLGALFHITWPLVDTLVTV
jgi:hypothetical protein